MGWIEKKTGPRRTTNKATIRTASRRKRSRTFKRKADAVDHGVGGRVMDASAAAAPVSAS